MDPSIAHYSLFIKQIGNNVGEIGVKSLSDALKRNTTLLKLDLSGEDKKNNTQMIYPSTIHSFPFSLNQQ